MGEHAIRQAKGPVLSSVFPIAPTPFLHGGELDLDGQRRVLDGMIDQGVDGICLLANYSEQFAFRIASATRCAVSA